MKLFELLGRSAEKNDRNSLELVVGFKVFAYLLAVHFRHIDVQQNQIRRIALRGQQRQLAGRNWANLIPSNLEHSCQHQQIGRGVVHDRDVGMCWIACWFLRIQCSRSVLKLAVDSVADVCVQSRPGVIEKQSNIDAAWWEARAVRAAAGCNRLKADQG